MKRFLIVALAAFTAVAAFTADTADARRLGGGRSLGTPRQATPPPAAPNVAPTNPAASAPGAMPRAAAPPPAAPGGSRWLGPLAGLAAGIGLAALFSHFGLSEGFASVLMLALLVVGGIVVARMFVGRRDSARTPLQYAPPNAAPGFAPGTWSTPAPAANRLQPALLDATPSGTFPPGFDPAPFVQQATLQFRKLQAAYDAGDRKALGEVMTPEMYSEIDREIAERGTHIPTDVASLEATVLDVTTEGDRHWASVQFTGMLREDGVVLPKPFEEVWNLVKPVDGSSGWLLAGIRQLA